MDWNKASVLANIGTFALTVVIVALMVAPMLPGRSLPPALRNMSGWAPIIVLAACLLLAGWLHLKAAQVANSASQGLSSSPPQQARNTLPTAPTVRETAPPIVQGVIPRTGAEDKIFLNKSGLELVAPFKSGITDYKAKKLVSDYLNKWVHWVVPITDVSQYGEKPHISVYLPDEPLRLYLSMYFLPSESAKVVHLEKGMTVEVEGRIDEIAERQVTLGNCRLVGMEPSP